MGISELLRDRIPKNEDIVKLRRKRRELEVPQDDLLAQARANILESGALDIIEELLEVVDGSVFSYSEENWNPTRVSRVSSLLSSPKPDAVVARFRWGFETEISEDNGGTFKDTSYTALAIVSLNASSEILVQSSSGALSRMFSKTLDYLNSTSSTRNIFFSQTLPQEVWMNRDRLEGVIIEALTLSGLTQQQLKPRI